MVIGPVFLEPMVNTFTPLPAGPIAWGSNMTRAPDKFASIAMRWQAEQLGQPDMRQAYFGNMNQKRPVH